MSTRKLPPSPKKAKTPPPKAVARPRPATPKTPPRLVFETEVRTNRIHIRLAYGSDVVRFTSGVVCFDPGRYDTLRMDGGISPSDAVQLREWQTRAERIAADLRLTGKPVKVQAIRDALFAGELAQYRTLTVNEGVDLYIADQLTRLKAGQIVERTLWKNRRWANDFRQWSMVAIGKQALLTDLKPANLRAFSLWLQTDRTNPDRATTDRLGNNAAEATASHAKVMARYWFDNEFIHKNPYMNFRRQMRPVEYHCLTEDEIARLFNLSLESKSLTVVRDIFLFLCLTAIGYAEVVSLKINNLKVDNDHAYLEVVRRKMQNRAGSRPALIPLDETALTILARYWPEDGDPEKPLFPVQQNAAWNRSLKQLAHMAGIDKPISTNYGRKSLANYALSKGLPNPTISAILGHVDPGTLLRHYARNQPSRILDDFGKMTNDLPNRTLYGLGAAPAISSNTESSPQNDH